MHIEATRTARVLGLALVLLSAPAAVQAQVGVLSSSGPEFMEAGPPQLRGPDSSFRDGYLLGTLALGVPSTVVSAANLEGRRAGGLWLGLAGIGLGVGHGALFAAGLREADPPSGATVWWNGIASAYSTVAGIFQIRSTIGDGPDSSSLKASITPQVDGVRLRVTWKR